MGMCALVGLCACIMRAVLVGGGEVWRAALRTCLSSSSNHETKPSSEKYLWPISVSHDERASGSYRKQSFMRSSCSCG